MLHTQQKTVTFKSDVDATEIKFDSLNSFSKCFMVMAYLFLRAFAKRQREVCVGFLSVMVRSYCVHPKHNFFTILILQWKGKHKSQNLDAFTFLFTDIS